MHFLCRKSIEAGSSICYYPAMRGIVSIIIGVIFIVGGLSGRLVLIGTDSNVGIMIVGGFLVALGVFRMVKARG